MASGSFKTNVVTAAGSGYYRQIEVIWSSTNNTTNNTSTVSWTAYSRATDSNNTARWVNAWNITVTINGVAKNINGSTTKALYKDTLIGSGSVTVAHANDGRKTGVPVAISASIWDSSKTNATYSGTINLDPNPVYTLTLTPGANTTITASRTASSGGGSTGNITTGTKLYYGDVLKISASPAENFQLTSLKVNGSNFTSGNSHTVSANVTVTTTAQALASVISVSPTSIALGSQLAISVTKYNSGYYHSISYSFANNTGYITSSGSTQPGETRYTNTSVNFTIPYEWGASMPSSTSAVCTLTCRTYSSSSGGQQLGNATTVSFTVSATSGSSGPQLTTYTVLDTNSTTVALTGSSSRLIKYMSTATCTLGASSRHGATLKTATISGASVFPGGSPTTITGAQRVFNEVTDSTFTFAVSDSRGYTASQQVTPTMVNYVRLTCVPVVERVSVSSESVKISASGSFFNGAFNSAGTNVNTLTISYRYKVNDGSSLYPSTWETIPASSITKSGATYSTSEIVINGTFDSQKAYTFQVRATDGIGQNILTTVEKEITIRRGMPAFDWGANTFNFNVGITFQDQQNEGAATRLAIQQQTQAMGMYFRNDMDLNNVTHPHSVSVTGGNPENINAFQVHDHNERLSPIIYQDDPVRLLLYAKANEYAYSYLADFPNEVKYDSTTGLYYRKWYSGVAEVWGTVTFTSVSDDSTTGGGNLHYSSQISKNLPVTFASAGSSAPPASITLTGQTSATWAINAYVSGSSFSTRIMRGSALGGSNYTFYVHIIGTMTGYTDRTYDTGGTPTPARAGGVAVITETDPESGGIVKHIQAVDLSNDTVDAAHLMQGYTAHDKNGNAITGTHT